MDELNFQVEQAVEGGYIARALGASIFAEAEDLEALNRSATPFVVTSKKAKVRR